MPRSKGRTGRPWRRLCASVLSRRPLVCWLCDEGIDPDAPYWIEPGRTNPGYPTVHHIIPITRGGDPLDPRNAVPAHLICNQRAGNKLPEELRPTSWVVGESP